MLHVEMMKERGFEPQFNKLEISDMILYKELVSMSEDVFKSMFDKITKTTPEDELFLHNIMLKRIEAFELENFIPDYFVMYIDIYNLYNPGRVILFVCLLVEMAKELDRKLTVSDVNNMFPIGFYNDDTCIWIIDNLIKTKIHPEHKIYLPFK